MFPYSSFFRVNNLFASFCIRFIWRLPKDCINFIVQM
nr:MAG TPA: hypothetical protein [Caudoviricetes sp.]